MAERAYEISAARDKKSEKCGYYNAALRLLVVLYAKIFLYHLRQSPCAEAGHKHRCDERSCGFESEFRKTLCRVGVFSETFYTSDSVAANDEGYEKCYAEHHDNSLNKVRASLNKISAEQQKHCGKNCDNYHAYFVVYSEQNIGNRCEAFVDRRRIRDHENKYNHAGKYFHGAAVVSQFKELRHSFYFEPV